MTTNRYRRRFPMIPILAVGLITFLLWANIFEIDQIVRAQGQVIARSRSQIIQVADGGILSSLKVHEGQRVVAGELLAELEADRAKAGFRESNAKVGALQAALERTRAEVSGHSPKFSGSHEGEEFVHVQRELYLKRKTSLDSEVESLSGALRLARDELRMNQSLLATGDVSRAEVLRSQRQVLDLEAQISSKRNKYLQEAQAEMAKLEEDLSSQQERLSEKKNLLEHTQLLAPVPGIVKSLRVTTIGGVLRPGDELMQIAPADDQLLIEAKVSPTDVGNMKVGLPALVKLDAFDYTVYGALQGEIVHLSPDTLTEAAPNGQQQSFYRVHVRIEGAQAQNLRSRSIVPLPGMTASLDIRTGSRTVMSYLSKPVVKTLGESMGER